MNVLPSNTRDDMLKLVNLVQEVGSMDCQLTVSRPHASNVIWGESEDVSARKIVLSTFGGGEASFGGEGWHGFLQECKKRDLDVSLQLGRYAPNLIKIAPLPTDIFHTRLLPPTGNHPRYAVRRCYFRLE